MTATRVKGIRLEGPDSKGKVVEDDVALESPINIYTNDIHFLTIFATPHQLKELAIGHLIGEGIIDSVGEITNVEVDGTDVLLTVKKQDFQRRLDELKRIETIISSCGSTDDYLDILDKTNKPRVHSDYTLSAKQIGDMLRDWGKESRSLKRSISVHSAALAVDGLMKYKIEDVSRHASVDKVIGLAAAHAIDFHHTVMFTTGRQTSDMVLKAARVGVPITVSLRGPIFSGIYAAQKTGVTYVSIASGKGLTVYAHPERIRMTF